MDNTFTLSTKKKIIYIICMLLTWLVIALPLLSATDPNRRTVDSFPMDEGWNVKINDTQYNNVTISQFVFPVTQKGDVLTLTKKIPSEADVKNPFFSILTVHCAFEMYLDNQMFYSYGKDRMEQNLMIGYGRSRVAVPDDYAGKEMKIVLYVTEDAAFDGLQKFEIVDGSEYFQYEYVAGRTTMFISIFLIGFGIIGMLFAILVFFRNIDMLQVFCAAMFATLAGIWTLCNAGLMEILVPEIYLKSMLEYMSLYSAPIPLTFYLYGRIKEPQCPKFLKRTFWVLIAIEVGFVSISASLHQLNIIHLPAVLLICHLIFVLAIIYVLTFAIAYIRKTKRVRKSIAFGLSFVCLVAFLEVIYFNFSKYITGFKDNKYNGTISILAFVIVITLFLDFFERMHTAVVEMTQKRLLENLAYMDELTALANRRKMDDTLVEYKEKNKSYAVVSLDMNYLKTLNDTYGHEMGDKALQYFAGCLVEIFNDGSLIGRMGGDEFAVIMEEAVPEQIDDAIERLNHRLGDEVFPGTSIRLSAASGYAFSYECVGVDDAYEIYRKSDARMYTNKRMMKIRLTQE